MHCKTWNWNFIKCANNNFFVYPHKTAFDVALTGAPNENIVENHLNIALLNVF